MCDLRTGNTYLLICETQFNIAECCDGHFWCIGEIMILEKDRKVSLFRKIDNNTFIVQVRRNFGESFPFLLLKVNEKNESNFKFLFRGKSDPASRASTCEENKKRNIVGFDWVKPNFSEDIDEETVKDFEELGDIDWKEIISF